METARPSPQPAGHTASCLNGASDSAGTGDIVVAAFFLGLFALVCLASVFSLIAKLWN
jgi:hypothetical protein